MICYWDLTNKRVARPAKHPEMFVGSLCSFCPICGLRGGVVFSGPFTRGLDSSGLAALPTGWEERKEMENREGWLGVSKGLFFQFIGPPHTHPLTHSPTHTDKRQSPEGKVRMWHHPQEDKPNNFFLSLLCCLCSWVKLEPLGLLVVGGSRGARGGRAAGAVLRRETEVKGSAG